MSAGVLGDQRGQILLELELPALTSCPEWMLGTKLKSPDITFSPVPRQTL